MEKLKIVLGIQSDIIQKWLDILVKMKPVALRVSDGKVLPTCTESCELYLAPITNKGSNGRGTYTMRDASLTTLTAPIAFERIFNAVKKMPLFRALVVSYVSVYHVRRLEPTVDNCYIASERV